VIDVDEKNYNYKNFRLEGNGCGNVPLKRLTCTRLLLKNIDKYGKNDNASSSLSLSMDTRRTGRLSPSALAVIDLPIDSHAVACKTLFSNNKKQNKYPK
jgi:hypothetical protein